MALEPQQALPHNCRQSDREPPGQRALPTPIADEEGSGHHPSDSEGSSDPEHRGPPLSLPSLLFFSKGAAVLGKCFLFRSSLNSWRGAGWDLSLSSVLQRTLLSLRGKLSDIPFTPTLSQVSCHALPAILHYGLSFQTSGLSHDFTGR